LSIDPMSMIGADYKSALQEKLQGNGCPAPEYALVEAIGPDHRRTFRVELRVAGATLSSGEGHTIKEAQQEAARAVLETSADSLDRFKVDYAAEILLESETLEMDSQENGPESAPLAREALATAAIFAEETAPGPNSGLSMSAEESNDTEFDRKS